jgi:predicted nucleic acid-binding protein
MNCVDRESTLMTLVDSSAWIEFLRATQSPTHNAVRDLLERDADVHTTDVVVMEVLAGARDTEHRDRLRRLFGRCEYVPVDGLNDFETAADLYRLCRTGGETVRALTDCLIAAIALRGSLAVLHADADFDVLARHVGLHARRS